MNEKECAECKNIIRESLNWKHYFLEQDVMNALVLDNNPELLRKVRACQAILDAKYRSKESIMNSSDEEARKECCNTFKKPAIDVEAL